MGSGEGTKKKRAYASRCRILACTIYHIVDISLGRSATVGLAKDKDLELVITSQDSSSSHSAEDISASTLEEGLVTLLGDDLLEGIGRRLVLDSLAGGHHNSSADGVEGVGGKTRQVGDTKAKDERGDERALQGIRQQGLDRVIQSKVTIEQWRISVSPLSINFFFQNEYRPS